MAGEGVTYTLSAFKRAGFVERGGPLLLEPRGGDPVVALGAMEAAAQDCNDFMERLEDHDIWGRLNAPVPTPAGPMSLVTECEPAKALSLMLERIKVQLESRGISGKLCPGKTTNHDFFDNRSLPCAGAGMFLAVDVERALANYEPKYRAPSAPTWAVPADVTQHVVEVLTQWVLGAGGAILVRIGATQILMKAAGLPAFVAATLPAEPEIAVRVTPHNRRCRRVSFSQYGAVMIQDFDFDRGYTEAIPTLTQLIRTLAPHSRGAFLRRMGTSTGDRDQLRTSAPTSPILDEVGASYWLTSVLEGDYVYDAFVSQVLTGSQLAKTQNLDAARWSVEKLGYDRHLVTHQNPERWFEVDTEPRHEPWHRFPPVRGDVLEQARADFGPAIMRPSTIEEHPPALRREEQTRALSPLGLIPR